MRKGRLNIIFDGQFGSTGKGKIAAYLARKYNIDLAISNNMPNAGHTFWHEGKAYITFHLPAAVANPTTQLALGPASAIYLPTLWEELEVFRNFHAASRLAIHPNAIIVEDRHRELEARELVRVSSTTKGCGAALADKVMRSSDLRQAKDITELKCFIKDTIELTHQYLESHKKVLAESAQGWGLSLNSRFFPFCTSRDITPSQTLNDCGVSHRKAGSVYVSLRTYPIRVGNVYDADGGEIGNSGPVYPDQCEYTWDEVTRASGSKVQLLEKTTVTDKIRRVFSFSRQMYAEMCRNCQPDFVFMNFANYIDSELTGKNIPADLLASKKWREWSRTIEWKCPVAYVGTGAGEHDMIDTMEDYMTC